MAAQSWQTSGNSTALSQKILRDKIYEDPRVQQALINYLERLNFQGQIDKGFITENQALKLFHDTLINFTRDCHTQISQATTERQVDPNDLTNPTNVERELQNPLSPLNTFLDNQQQIISDAIAQAIMDEDDADQQTQAIQNLGDEGNEIYANTSDETQEKPKDHASLVKDVERCAEIGVVLKLIDDADPEKIEAADKAVEDAFQKVTGVKGDTHSIKDAVEHDVDDVKKEFALKPKPPQDK